MKLPRMLSLVRWRYVLPRAVAAAVVVLAVRYGLDPLLHWALVASGEAALGAKVEIAELTTSLRDGEVVVRKFAAANPAKPMRNLLEAAELHLVVDAGQLLRKRVVVHEGFIRGIRFDSPRSVSGALGGSPIDVEADSGPSMFDPLATAAADGAAAWFESLEGRVAEDLEARLATPRLARELQDRWPRQYEALRARADGLRRQVRQVESEFREAKKNPLRSAMQIEQLQQQLVATQADLKATLAEINALPAQAKSDRAAIDAARKQDEQFLKDAVRVAQVDGDQLTQYLLGDEAHGYLQQTVYWIQTVRRYIPQRTMAKPTRARGVDILFGARRQPRMLIERVDFAASATLDGQQLDLTGEMTDAASEPQWHDRPLRLRLASTGAVAATLVAELDRRGDLPHDSLVLDCPKLAMPVRALGQPGRMAVNLTAGDASVHADLRLDGDQLAGVIELRQSSRLEAATGVMRDDRIGQLLNESIAEVDRVEAKVNLAGTLQRPKLKIESNLGPQLAAGVNGAVKRYVADRKDRLLAKVNRGVDEQLAKLEAKRQSAQRELLAQLGDDQKLMGQLAGLSGGHPSLDAAATELTKKLNLDKLTK